MAGSLGWPILRDYADAFVSCEDHVTEVAMYTLFHPLGDDKKVVSGESGAVCLGVVIQADAAQRQLLKLDENSKVLCVSTEGYVLILRRLSLLSATPTRRCITKSLLIPRIKSFKIPCPLYQLRDTIPDKSGDGM